MSDLILHLNCQGILDSSTREQHLKRSGYFSRYSETMAKAQRYGYCASI